MFRSILSMSLSVLAGAVLMASSAAAEPQYSRAGGTIVLAHNGYGYGDYDDRRESPNDRTCCRREERGGYSIYRTTIRECRWSRGERQTNKECRKHGGFHRYEGYGWGGHGGNGGDWNERVCCTRQGQVWWSTRGECRRAYGEPTANRFCRR